MFRSNTSFATELPDGSIRSVTEGQMISEDDALVETHADLLTSFEPQPGPSGRPVTSRRSAKDK